jgi:hypothetical protein
MFSFKITICIIATFFIFVTITSPVQALVYTPGVSVGQYVKYGNFIGIGPGEETINNTDFVRLEVTAVSGAQITLFTTGQLKDGAPTAGNSTTTVWNIETGTQDGAQRVQGPVIAANLNQGDPIPPPSTYTVNKTETQTYLGISRTVNILNTTITTPDYTTSFTFVYDRTSGILLAATSITIQTQSPTTPSEYSYIITETNIFGTSQTTPSPSPTIPEYSSIVLAVVAILVTLTAVILRRKRECQNNVETI